MNGLVNVSKSRRDPSEKIEKSGEITLDAVAAIAAQVLRENPDPDPELEPWYGEDEITFRTNPHPENLTADGVVVVNPGGMQVGAVSKFSVLNPQGGGAVGRRIKGMSAKSRKRLMRHLMAVDLESIAAERKGAKFSRAMFVTLTYPWMDGKPFSDWERAKEHLEALRKRLERAYGIKWAVWKQEYQESGALHFHLVLNLSRVVRVACFRAWLAQAWYEIVESGNPDHLAAGTGVEPVYIEQGQPGSLLSYLSKELGGSRKRYQDRAFDPDTGELIESGKTWGIWGRGDFEAAKVIICKITVRGREAWQRFKENVARRFEKSRYLRRVASIAWWGGGLLYGNGGDLMNELLDGIPEGAWEYV
ncbi:MAG TPA: hypothetical protein PLJ78_07070 [Anaerolineae bacterium]|nr:hypothetical protein [Anaerolineae bacterium]HQK13684.1 hypothetical protein [Anaerolineae bacterium]